LEEEKKRTQNSARDFGPNKKSPFRVLTKKKERLDDARPQRGFLKKGLGGNGERQHQIAFDPGRGQNAAHLKFIHEVKFLIAGGVTALGGENGGAGTKWYWIGKEHEYRSDVGRFQGSEMRNGVQGEQAVLKKRLGKHINTRGRRSKASVKKQGLTYPRREITALKSPDGESRKGKETWVQWDLAI